MLENYLNPAAQAFLDRLPGDKERNWAWMVIEEIRRRFPQADHWTTGGVDKNYIDLRFGIKRPEKKRGWPKLNLSYWQGTLYCTLHSDFEEENGNKIATTPDRSSNLKALKKWFSDVELRLKEAGIQLSGSGLNPKDFKPEESSDAPATKVRTKLNDKSHDRSLGPLNLILYGPPGTGKTYATIDATLAILDPDFVAVRQNMPEASQEEISLRRKELKEQFDKYQEEKRVRFVTFHQSFSYEDFVEGIRAVSNEDLQLTYGRRRWTIAPQTLAPCRRV